MKCLRSLSKKLFTFVCSLLGLHFLISCGNNDDDRIKLVSLYGMPGNYGQISGTIRGDVNGDGTTQPLANVKIYGDEDKPGSTDEKLILTTHEDGHYWISLWKNGEYTFRFVDGDGAENGQFKSQTKTFTFKEGTSQYNQDITLEKE